MSNRVMLLKDEDWQALYIDGELVQEMANRGYQHKSPLPLLPAHLPIGSINKEHNYEYLRNNCAQCEERIKEYGNN